VEDTVAPPAVLKKAATETPRAAAAQEQDVPTPLESPVAVHGFASVGFVKTTKNNYLGNSERGSFEFTEVGVNFTKELTERFRAGIQLFARKLGSVGGYSAQFDWFYLDYRFADWLGIRAGRTKLPFGLYNETSDVDAARVPVLLPQSLYPIQNRDFLLAQTGVELYGFVSLDDGGDLHYRAYGGTLNFDPQYEGAGDTIKKVSTPYVVGGRLMWGAPLQGLQLGGSVQVLRLDLDYLAPDASLAPLRTAGLLPAGFSGIVSAKVPAVLLVASVEYAVDELLLSAEYGRWRTHVESTLPVLFPETTTWNERFYGMASYRVSSWLAPGAYYSAYFPNADQRNRRDKYQHDIAATLRFDLNAFWLLKLEGHFIYGTAALDSSLNGNVPRSSLERDWGLFLVKTTAYF